FNHDLGTTLVQLIDDFTQAAVERIRCGDKQGVGSGVGLHSDATCGKGCALVVEQAAAQRAGGGGPCSCPGAAGLAVGGTAAGAGCAACALHATATAAEQCSSAVPFHVGVVGFAGEQPAQCLCQGDGLGVAQVDHMQVVGAVLGAVKFVDQLAGNL